eukprot:TRINITY_DN8657_c0_g1_i1.p1 TRINITY_DN8657_c0_g1~~TRINITY_DN8657_c0_g1_i1.p1  ORF type:complete len:287 (-),score=34.06 TRINITY_DN8657_c0_g1_i1:113-973(-)
MRLMLYEEWIKSPNQADKIPLEREIQFRNESVSFIRNMCTALTINFATTAKAIVIFHMFSKQFSFRKFNRWHYAAACVLLCCKLDDYNQNLESISEGYMKAAANTSGVPKVDDKAKLGDMLYEAERNILRSIGFDVDIHLPYRFLEELAAYPIRIDPMLLRTAHEYINNSLKTIVCLYYDPLIIAMAAVHLAMKQMDVFIPDTGDGRSWYKFFDRSLEMDVIEQCSTYINDPMKVQDSRAVFILLLVGILHVVDLIRFLQSLFVLFFHLLWLHGLILESLLNTLFG